MMIKLKIEKAKSLEDLIASWSNLYYYKLEKLYDDNINEPSHDEKSLSELFKWKNGMKLSGKKQKSFDVKIKAHLKIINEIKSDPNFDLEAFREKFKEVSFVWRIFLIHVIKPQQYPIYDQHIHRGFLYIHENDHWKTIKSDMSDKKKEQFYFEVYIPWVNSLEEVGLKKLDEALFSFGRTLVHHMYKKLLYHYEAISEGQS